MHKLKFPLGPWSTEPDEKHWVDAATGLHCYIKRHPYYLHLCGYVGVPAGHHAYTYDYNKLTLSVHGGVTHANCIECSPMPDLWWIGFDCNHAFDYAPGDDLKLGNFGVTPEAYRDMEYVTRECTRLAEQLKYYVPEPSLKDQLKMVLARAKGNRNALSLEEETALNNAFDAVGEYIKYYMED